VPLSAVWAPTAIAQAEQTVAASSRTGRALEELIGATGRGTGAPDPLAAEVTRRARSGERVAAIGVAVGLSDRQLQRRSLDWFGYGPKTLVRVLRLVAALDLARSGVSLAAVAARCGYADQPHLAGDALALTGATLTELGLGGRASARVRSRTQSA
jgi:transcriptional regulator GlxA family with amidase domain